LPQIFVSQEFSIGVAMSEQNSSTIDEIMADFTGLSTVLWKAVCILSVQ